MTAGERMVVLVRAQALSDALHQLLASGGRQDFAVEAVWQAQRLRSSCERNLGTRERPYD